MKKYSVLTSLEASTIIKQVADWARTISAGAIVLGLVNPALIGEDVKIAVWYVGFPCLLGCLSFSVIAQKMTTPEVKK